MQKVFHNPSRLEFLAKQKYCIPDFLMMENAALAIQKLILQLNPSADSKCLILCGKGNNGGDGYALARHLLGKLNPLVFTLEAPTSNEAKAQHLMCKKMGLPFITKKALMELLNDYSKKQVAPLIIVDCLYGTGFKGQLLPAVQKILQAANEAKATRIACDISSGLAFQADYTVTMGENKLALFSDQAKKVSGQVIVAPLGLETSLFESAMPTCLYLVTKDDLKLPWRTNNAAHKGTYGHTAVFAGQKAGASILCASAALNFGSGLTSLIAGENSGLRQFKIPPELMISSDIPAKASCLVLGPGLEAESCPKEALKKIEDWFNKASNKSPAAVFDAGLFGNQDFISLLQKISSKAGARLVLTPHLLEFNRFCKNLKLIPKLQDQLTVENLANAPEIKHLLGQKITSIFPNVTVVIKSANTFIADKGKTYIVADGGPSLAKGGSGDLLAGMIASLLAQGYSSLDAAITACEFHALASVKNGKNAWDLSPSKLLKIISEQS